MCFYNIQTTTTKAGPLPAFIKRLCWVFFLHSKQKKGQNDKEHTNPLYTTRGDEKSPNLLNFFFEESFHVTFRDESWELVQVQTLWVKWLVRTCVSTWKVLGMVCLSEGNAVPCKEWLDGKCFGELVSFICPEKAERFCIPECLAVTVDLYPGNLVFRIQRCAIGLCFWYNSVPCWCCLHRKMCR